MINFQQPLIHYGSSVFDLKRFKKIKNSGFWKPNGGLWASPVNSKRGWTDWCMNVRFYPDALKQSFQLHLKATANVCVINKYEDLCELPVFYFDHLDPPLKRSFPQIDFENLARDYDAIWLTAAGESATRYTTPLTLHGWDCECVLILRPSCFHLLPN